MKQRITTRILVFLALISFSVAASAESARFAGLLIDGIIYGQYDGSVAGTFTPVFVYADADLFGGGNALQFFFAGVYADLDVTIVQKPGLPFSITMHGDGTIEWGSEETFYRNGEEMDWIMRGPSSNLGLGLCRYTDSGFAIGTNHIVSFRDYNSDSANFTPPSNTTTYTGNLELSLTRQSVAFPSPFARPVGFRVAAVPEIIYQFDFGEWGPNGGRYSHDDRPAYRGLYQASYYRDFAERLIFGGEISYLYGANAYQLEKWYVGTTTKLNAGPRLSGYYPREFLTTGSTLLNIDALLVVVPDLVAVSAAHDVFYHREEHQLYHGSSLGVAFKLPNGMELNLKSSIGWNAERSDGLPGWMQELAFMYSF